jgi:hypothetical protein
MFHKLCFGCLKGASRFIGSNTSFNYLNLLFKSLEKLKQSSVSAACGNWISRTGRNYLIFRIQLAGVRANRATGKGVNSSQFFFIL